MEAITFDALFPSWQQAARRALARGLEPASVLWRARDQKNVEPEFALFPEAGTDEGQTNLSKVAEPSGPLKPDPRIRVPREFLEKAPLVACIRDEDRWALLYRILWRLTHGEPQLLEVSTDPDVIEFEHRAKEIRRDSHKMHAFVRFREVEADGETRFVAWFEPKHLIVELNARFFVDRFHNMKWSILTPDRCMHWDGAEVTYTPGVSKEDAPQFDDVEDLWRTYYRNIFNPARIKVGAMKKEMAPYYWKNLPEARIIPELLAEAPARVERMVELSKAKAPADFTDEAPPIPSTQSLDTLAGACQGCRACPLWKLGTQAVFGEGPKSARVLVVGEQPGDQEDKAGKPFVGPAGKLLDRALEAAGVDRAQLYVTNAVKHFKWEPRGKARIHQKPSAREINACRPWLEKEIELVAPDMIVCLGATAAYSVLQRTVKVTQQRGELLPTGFNVPALITVHPSSLLRQPDRSRAEADFEAFVQDLQKIRKTPGL